MKLTPGQKVRVQPWSYVVDNPPLDHVVQADDTYGEIVTSDTVTTYKDMMDILQDKNVTITSKPNGTTYAGDHHYIDVSFDEVVPEGGGSYTTFSILTKYLIPLSAKRR